MADLTGFDADHVEPTKPPDPLPNGKYPVAIVASEFKATKDGNGSYLQLSLQVVDGEYKGRKLFDRLNLNNPSDVAVGIARAQLSAICRACGNPRPGDSSNLHNIPMLATVKCKKRDDKPGEDEWTNEVKGYEALTARPAAPAYAPPATPTAPVAPVQQAPKPTPTGATGPAPWLPAKPAQQPIPQAGPTAAEAAIEAAKVF